MPMIDRTPTGIPGLDEILGGGFPRGRVILLVGGPGTGKTILTSQFLINGIKIYGENGAFVSLDETKAHFIREMGLFSWKFDELEKAKKFAFINASPLRHMRSEEHTSELQSHSDLVCRLLLEKKKKQTIREEKHT